MNKLIVAAICFTLSMSWTPAHAQEIDYQEVAQFETNSDIGDIAWSSDSVQIAVATVDNAIRIWNVATQTQVTAFDEDFPTRLYIDIEWNRANSLLAVIGGQRDYINIWDTTTQEIVNVLDTAGQTVEIEWSPDDALVAALLHDGTIQFWNSDTWELETIWHYEPVANQTYGVLRSLRWNPDSMRVAIAEYREGGAILIIDVETSEIVMHISGSQDSEQMYYAAWSPTGETIMGGHGDNAGRGNNTLWNAETGEIIGNRGDALSVFDWNPNGIWIAQRHPFDDSDDYDPFQIEIYELLVGTIATLQGHTSGISDLAWSPDGILLASASQDHTVRIWGQS